MNVIIDIKLLVGRDVPLSLVSVMLQENTFKLNILLNLRIQVTEIACNNSDLSSLTVLGTLPVRSFANSPSYQNPNGYLEANFPQLRISQLWLCNLLLLRIHWCVGCNQRHEVTYYGKAESGSHHHLSVSGS